MIQLGEKIFEKSRNAKDKHKEFSDEKNNSLTFVLNSLYSRVNLRSMGYSFFLIFTISGLFYNFLWHFKNSNHRVCENCVNFSSGIIDKLISARNFSVSPLNVFQVYQPVTFQSATVDGENLLGTSAQVVPGEGNIFRVCDVKLMEYSFGNSYGKPFIGEYMPPPCEFNRVIMNFTANSQGRQFDRLAIMYLNDIEVWRTSTAEPKNSGIVFEYIKDMSAYMSLWKNPQKLIFDLGNLVDETYTGHINATLSARFYMATTVNQPADQIIPVSLRKSNLNAPSVFKLPSDIAVNSISLPRNAYRAVFSVSACGQGNEEFWWQNVLHSNTETFKDVKLFGYSPFREVQILIDGHLAGVQWPFPIIFTGGVAPGLWRPIVGIDTYDLRDHVIDITPWLSILSDGLPHRFEIRVVGIQEKGEETGKLTDFVGDNWLVSGKIFLWQDSGDGTSTYGSQPEIDIEDPVIKISSSITQNATGANETLTYVVDISRTISISSTINTADGPHRISWKQNLTTTNYGQFTAQGNIQVNSQITNGKDESTGGVEFQTEYSYPLWCRTSGMMNELGDVSFSAQIRRGLTLRNEGTSVYPTGIEPFLQNYENKEIPKSNQMTHLETIQNGTAFYSSSKSSKMSISHGTLSQVFRFLGSSNGLQMRELYYRNVAALNDTLTYDQERILGRDLNHSLSIAYAGDDDMMYPLNLTRNLRHNINS
ncbi:Peptide-N4-(N-acetyl-beta-glucosaminyl)asparagine amidase A [Erysiphe necator]|nr:Peptide-N4-(N-acetyl-beta-glucosaminyl)asparagine amidase A [Erysiphe necator]